MKLIQCPLCPLASQIKSVILSHISQVHPDHPKRIITTSYTTCQKKLQEEDNEPVEETEKPKERRRTKSSASGLQQDYTSETSSEEVESQKQKTKPNILQKRQGVVGGIGGSMNCNFVCGTCSFSTNIQDDFHDHIISCVKTKNSSPKPSQIQPSRNRETEPPQPVIIEPDGVQAKLSKDHSRMSKPGFRAWEGTEVELHEEAQASAPEQDNVPDSNGIDQSDEGPEQTETPESEQTPEVTGRPQLEIAKPTNIPPEPGKSMFQILVNAYTGVNFL